MKSNKTVIWLALGLALLLTFGFLVDMACFQLPEQLREAKAQYQSLVVETTIQNNAAQAERQALLATIAEREASEAVLKAKVAQDAKELALAHQTIAALQASEPPTTPEIEALPVVVSLRAQVRAFSVALAVAERTISDQSDIIFKLEQDKKDLWEWGASWEAQYEREHTLRLASENLFKLSEHRFKLNKTVTYLVVGAAGAGLVYSLVRK